MANVSKLEERMKQKIIKTDKATFLVVELLPKINLETIKIIEGTMYYHDHIGRDGISVPEGNWQLLGRLPDITEEQTGSLVEKAKDFVTGEMHYLDYEDETNLVGKATQALRSLLRASGVCFDNPLGDEPKITSGEYDDNGFGDIDKHQFKRDLKSWQQAQSKVWDKERCYLFIKVD